MKESAKGMLSRLLEARSLTPFMNVNSDVPEKQSSMVVLESLVP